MLTCATCEKPMPRPSRPPPLAADAALDPLLGGVSDAPVVLPESGLAARHAAALLEACGLESVQDGPAPAGSPALDWARSGAMMLCGQRDRPPRFAAGPLATAARGVGLALDGLVNGLSPDLRADLPPGKDFDWLDAPALLGERAALFGFERAGRSAPGGRTRLLSTRDATLALNLPRDEDVALMPAWLEAPELSSTRLDWDAIEERLGQLETREIVARGRLMGLAVAEAPRHIDASRPFFRRSAEGPPVAREAQTPGPVRVLDLSTLWAGPLAGSLLARAGCDVLKVESPTRPDGARRGEKRFFDLMNGGKRGCALDLHEEADRRTFEGLLARADVVIESARPRGLEQLGFDAADWVAERPGRIWASITGYGRTAPERDWIAFGDDAAVAAGLAWSPPSVELRATGEPEEQTPCFCADAIADPLTGLHVAAIVLAHRRRGLGGLLDFALVDIAARSAALALEERTLAVARDDSASSWCVIDGDRRIPIAVPRARPVGREAPPLAPPPSAGLAGWRDGPC